MRLCALVIFIAAGCTRDAPTSETGSLPPGDGLFTRMPAESTGIHFVNDVRDTEQFNVLTYRNFYNGGGVAIGDINGDGLSDIYLTANMGGNILYLNKGNWQFEDITAKAGVAGERGWSTGVAMADVNGDGWLDIYVCNSGDIDGDNKENELFINHGDLTFSEEAGAYGLNDEGFSTHASFFDYDLDGDLDCYILNNSFRDPEKIDAFTRTREEKDVLGGDKLFRNDGSRFANVTDEAGIYTSPIGFGLGVSVSDLNGDMWPDIYISNDFWERDYLYLNQQDGTFSEELTSRISMCSVSSMGADIADLNNDGSYDIYTTDMLAADNYRLKAMTVFDPYHLEDYKYRADYHYQILQNCLQINDGNAGFQEVAHMAGIAATDWSWGALIFDFDNDGWKDIFVCNGIYHEIMYLDFTNFINDKEEIRKIVTEKGRFDWRDFVDYMPSNPLSNFAFVNQTARQQASRAPRFVNQADSLGLGEPAFSNGAAYGDLDNDGDYDLVINNVNMPAFIYRNGSTHHFLKVRFEGSEQNPFAVGAEVRIQAGGQSQKLQHYLSRGFQSAVEPGLIFGLGDARVVDRVQVIWPDHAMQTLTDIPVDTVLTVSRTDASERFVEKGPGQHMLLGETTTHYLAGDHKHVENTYNDFDHEILLPRMLSTEGPRIIRGDVDGDGLEDFIVAGSSGDADKLFLQRGGRWRRAAGTWEELAEADKDIETTCGAIFDADGDGDNDILLGAGGNEYERGINNFVLRYYENTGAGTLVRALSKTPPAAGNVSCILPEDIDQDGDMDLFIGGRAVPGHYGLVPRSFLFRNDGPGRWTDISDQQIGMAGMVTDGVWSDVDQDSDRDLILVGDWMEVAVYENNAGQLQHKMDDNGASTSGWWTRIVAADLDGDGDDDYILGNWGLNSKFKASEDRPLTMYVKDFDQNGRTEFIINWYPPLNDSAYPFATKMDITRQMPHLNKTNLKYEDYAHQTYTTLLTPEERAGAIEYKASCLETSVLLNTDSGLRRVALPVEAQVSPVFGIAAEDFNGDGNTDLWLGGNFFGLKPEVGRMDASKGVFLAGDGQGNFRHPTEVAVPEIEGEVREAQVFDVGGEKIVIIARNNAGLVVLKTM